ncbi:hypothetical protein [Bifidobacterium psychraerophilum]|uniref:hypothetical protein n=1 Tax=Bifidobacterium psychraerophilum TaxID=218140 RepID=UPI0039EBE6A1
MLLYDAGLVAYVWWLASVVLSTRPRWLDRHVGLPALYAVHGMLGVLAIVLATIHVQFSFSMHAIIRNLGFAAWHVGLFSILYAGFFLSGILVDRFPFAARVKSRLQFFFKHELSIWIHRLNLVMIALIWLHVHVIPRISRMTGFMIVFDAYTLVGFAAYAWYKSVAPSSERRSGLVIENTEIAPDVHQITIRLGTKAPQYRAGDFYFLRFPHVRGVSPQAHPFSVTFAPNNARTVTFTVKGLGDFTRSLKNVTAGTDVRLEGPYGRFDPIISATDRTVPLVLIGMGTGLAPLVSIAGRYASQRRIQLLWSVRSDEKDMFSDELERLSVSNRERVSITRHLHRFRSDDYQDLIDASTMQTASFIIVGPANAVITTKRILRGLGVPHARILDERLTM